MIDSYRLDALGWWQFESLCQTLLQSEIGLGLEVWGGHSDLGRDAYFPGDLAFPEVSRTQRGPFVFQAKFVADSAALGARVRSRITGAARAEAKRIAQRIKDSVWESPGCYVLLTNVRLTPSLRRTLSSTLSPVLPGARILLLGEAELSARLNAAPHIRTSFPQLLSLRDIGELITSAINHGLSNRSDLLLQEARLLAPVFMPTRAYRQALTLLSDHNFVVLTGPPELGKTSIALMIALARSTEGWQIFDCRSPDDFFSARQPRTKQLFIADDAFGTTEFDPALSSEWAQQMPRVLLALERGQQQLIWTSRPEPLSAALVRLRERTDTDVFPDGSRVLVDAGRISVAEKALMLYQHAKQADFIESEKQVVRRMAQHIVTSRHFTPERIRRFAASGLRRVLREHDAGNTSEVNKAVLAEISHATARMQNSYEALGIAEKTLLFSMLDTGAAGGSAVFLAGATGKELDEAFARHSGDSSTGAAVIAERLRDHFLLLHDGYDRDTRLARVFSWMHPSWRDLVIDNLSANTEARHRFLRRSTIRGLALAISTRGGATGTRRFPLLQIPADWDVWAAGATTLLAAERTTGTALLEILRSAFQSASADELPLLEPTAEKVLEAVRQSWNESMLTAWSLGLYWDVAHHVRPLPPSPAVYESWNALIETIEAHLSADAMLPQDALDAVVDWLDLVDALAASEPRLLRQLSYPDGYTRFHERLADAVTSSAQLVVESSVEDESDLRTLDLLQTVLQRLAASSILLSDFDPSDVLYDLEVTIAEEGPRFQEPDLDDDDRPSRSTSDDFDIDMLFTDL